MIEKVKPRKTKYGFRMSISGIDGIITAGKVCEFSKRLDKMRIEHNNNMGKNELRFYTDCEETSDRFEEFARRMV